MFEIYSLNWFVTLFVNLILVSLVSVARLIICSVFWPLQWFVYSIVLIWVSFLEEAGSSSFGDKTNNFIVCANRVTPCHVLQSPAGLQGFRSEIGYQIFDQV